MQNSKKFFDAFREFFILSSIFGLWPSWKSCKYPTLLTIYSLLQIVYIIIFGLFAFWNFELTGSTLSVIIGHSILWSILLTHLVVIIEALIHRNAHLHLIEKFSSVDLLIKSKLRVVISYRTEKSTIFYRLSLQLIISFLIRIALAIHMTYRHKIDIIWYQCLLSIWVIRMRNYQMLVFVFMLRTRLHYIYEKLSQSRIGYNLYSQRKNQWIIGDDNTGFVLDSMWTKNPLYEQLIILKQIYGRIYEICEQINHLFGSSLLTVVVQSFMDIITNLYWIYQTLQITELDVERAIDCTFFLVPVVTNMIIMCFYCSSCSRYVRKKKNNFQEEFIVLLNIYQSFFSFSGILVTTFG